MADVLQCTDPISLQRVFSQGGGADEIEKLAAHLEQCTRCGEMFDDLLRSDVVAQALLQPGSKVMDDSAAVQRLRELLAQLGPASSGTFATLGSASIDTSSSATIPPESYKSSLSFLSPPQLADEIGRLGTYRVLEQLGAGGMGMIFLAEDTMLKRKVALKTMLPHVAVNPHARERFLREARAAAAIEHPHIITIHQVGENAGVPFLAMPLLKGESLKDRLARWPKLPLNDAIKIACEIAEGLAAAHAQGLIHRDIKPGNIWLEDQPVRATVGVTQSVPHPFKVKLLDFGLARSEVDDVQLTHSGAIIGTPGFMAPEQARGEPIDGRADLFSLGCVMYVMFTGQRPFTGATLMALLTALAVHTPKAPRELNPDVPEFLSDFTMRLLAKNPADRFPSAEAVADELRMLLYKENDANQTVLQSSSAKETVASPAILPAKHPKPAVMLSSALPTARRPSHRIAITMGVALLMLIFGGFAAYQLIFKTPDGTLIVEVDGDADVRFQKGTLRIFDTDGNLKYTLKPSERNRSLPLGKYLVDVAGADGLKVVTDKFEIKRADQTTVRVTVDPVAVAKVEGWVSLFNGKDLTGWKKRAEDRGNWRVENGVLFGSGPETCFLFTERGNWSNFHVRVETRITDAGSGGVVGRAQFESSYPAVHGYNAKINVANSPDPRKSGSLYVSDKDGFMDGNQIDTSSVKADEWFTLDLVVEGDRILIQVNGKTTTDYVDKKRRFSSGNIALQVYNPGAQIQFRKIEIRELPATSADAERQVAEWVLSMGGTVNVHVGDNDPGPGITAAKDLPAQEFRVHFVGFPDGDNKHITDAALAQLKPLTDLKVLVLPHTSVTDSGLEELKTWPKLVGLSLGGSKVTDAGMEIVRTITNLTSLDLNGTKVTDAGLERLKPLVKLDNLVIQGTPITDIGLVHLKAFPNLISLDAQWIALTDGGMVHIKNMSKLQALYLAGRQLSDVGVKELMALTELETLHLQATSLSDAGLKHLYALDKLQFLRITDSKVTADGVAALHMKLPDCKIEWDGVTIEPNHFRPSLASPLDKLDAAKIPAAERFSWQPKELVAVVGEHRQKHWGGCNGLALSPDGRVLASVGQYDRKVRLWDPATLQAQGELDVQSGSDVAFSPDGKWLAVADESSGQVHVWDCGKSPFQHACFVRVDSIYRAAFGQGGKVLVTLNGWPSAKLGLWDMTKNPPEQLAFVDGHECNARGLAVAPDGKTVATAGTTDGLIKLWDIGGEAPKEIATFGGHKGDIRALAFSADSKLLFSQDPGEAMTHIWAIDGPASKEKETLRHATWNGGAGPFAHDTTTNRLAIGSGGGFTICTLEDGNVKPLYDTSFNCSGIAAMAFGTPDQGLLMADGTGRLRCFKVGAAKATQINEPPGIQGNIAAFASGRLAVPRSTDFALWDLNAPGPQQRGQTPSTGGGWPGPVALTGDGAFLASGQWFSRTIELWDLRTNIPRLVDRISHDMSILPSTWDPEGKTLLVRTEKGTVLILERDGDNLKERASIKAHEGYFDMWLSRDGKTLATGAGTTARIWNLTTGELREKGKVTTGYGSPLALSPDGQTLIVCNGPIKRFDLGGPSPRETGEFELLGDGVSHLSFSPDGKSVVGCSYGGGVVLWDAATGKKACSWQFPGVVNGAAFAEDGRHLLTFNGNGTVYVLRLASVVGKR